MSAATVETTDAAVLPESVPIQTQNTVSDVQNSMITLTISTAPSKEDALVTAINALTSELEKMEKKDPRINAKKLANVASQCALIACPATTPLGKAGRLTAAYGAALGIIHAVRLSKSPVAEPAAGAAITAAKLYAGGIKYKDQNQRIVSSTSVAIRRVLDQCLADWPDRARQIALDLAIHKSFKYGNNAKKKKKMTIEIVKEPKEQQDKQPTKDKSV